MKKPNPRQSAYIVGTLLGLFLGVLGTYVFFKPSTPPVEQFGAQVSHSSNVQGNSIDFSKIVDSANLDANFTIASAGFGFATGSNFVAGSTTASSSVYTAEFVSTGTTSINFTGSSTTKGTCFQMRNTAGVPVYLRVNTTTVSVTTVKCHQ